MGTTLREKIGRYFGRTEPPAPDEESVRLREAVGVTVDADDDQWRRLTDNSDRDLSPMTQQRMQKMAAWLWEANLLANRLIELPLAYLLAEGVKLTCKDADGQAVLNAFWRDPINNMPLKLAEKVRELAIFGEQCWPIFVNEHSGKVRLGYLDPQLIATIVMDPDNSSQPIGIVTHKDRKGKARRYRIAIRDEEEAFTSRTQAIRATFTDGECFYYRVNNMASGTRGRSDLLAQADWLDAYDQFLFGELDRAKFQRMFFFDVTLKGATPEQVAARAREISAPSPASVRVHNDSEEWDTPAPNLQAGDSAEHARLFRNHILGGATMPEHWYGGGGDVNRAVGAEMSEPTFKCYSMRQGFWKLVLEDMGRFALYQANEKGQKRWDLAADEFQPEAQFPELTAKDTTKWASALQQVAASLAIAMAQGLFTKATACKLLAAVAGRLGVEIDAEAELEAAQAEADRAREADVFTAAPAQEDPAAAA